MCFAAYYDTLKLVFVLTLQHCCHTGIFLNIDSFSEDDPITSALKASSSPPCVPRQVTQSTRRVLLQSSQSQFSHEDAIAYSWLA